MVVIVAPVADKDAFLVVDSFRVALGVVVGEGRVIFGVALEGGGQMAGWVDVAEEDLSESSAARLSGVPRLKERGHRSSQPFESTLPPEVIVTMVLGFAAAISRMSSSWP